jgi:magnesium transporter
MSDEAPKLEELRQLAAVGDVETFALRAGEMHPSDVADVLAGLDDELRLRFVSHLPLEIVSQALAEMEEEEQPGELLAAMIPERAADILEELEDDDAADLVADLSPETAQRILSDVDVEDRADIERLLEYEEDSAGGRMTTAIVIVPERATAAEAIAEIRRQAEEVEDFYQIYCVDDRRHLVGILALQRLVVAHPSTRVKDLMEPPPATATAELDQEEVARLMARYNVPAIAVIDTGGRLLGRVTFDDVIDVVEAERTEDLLMFGGLGGGAAEAELGGPWHGSVRRRLPWLYLNLITAFLAGAVVYVFQETVAQVVVLAALMPIVAGLGGNAGTQSLAITVRRIALGLNPPGTALGHIAKEMLIGGVNGLAVGAVVAIAAAALGQGWQLGLVVLLAMWGNQVVAVTLGAAVPLGLQRLGVDPAVASSVFVTAFTDVVGFALLLGLAAWLLL